MEPLRRRAAGPIPTAKSTPTSHPEARQAAPTPFIGGHPAGACLPFLGLFVREYRLQ